MVFSPKRVKHEGRNCSQLVLNIYFLVDVIAIVIATRPRLTQFLIRVPFSQVSIRVLDVAVARVLDVPLLITCLM